MKKILLFDTSVATLNMGDEIIIESIKKNLKDFFSDKYVYNFPTHTPTYKKYQTLMSPHLIRRYTSADYKFVCGTNLLYTNMLRPVPGWNINIFNTKIQQGAILLGVGCGVNSNKTTLYSKMLYKKVLSNKYIHSTRDEKTKIMLEEMGIKAINTGCPTLWSLTDEHCKKIPKSKANQVVFTLTSYGYARDIVKDKKMIDIIKQNYKTIYFWPQCIDDLSYLEEIDDCNGINILSPNLSSYKEVLQEEVDYIGSRLHGGIFALQHAKRTIILSIDNRAREMKKTYSIPCIERDEIDKLDEIIKSNFNTKINGLDFKKINQWLDQFKN